MNSLPQMILLVDDDADFLATSRFILESAGYRVVCAGGVDEAWERVTTDKPCLVIADLMMDTLDAGFAFARRLRADARFRDVPLVILTAIARQRGYDFSPQSADDLAATGADAFLAKPATAATLLGAVQELLAQREGRK